MRTRRLGLAVPGSVLLAISAFLGNVVPAGALLATDTAVPVYQFGSSTGDKMSCPTDGTACSMVESTITGNYPCTAETIAAASIMPVLLYTNTYCNVSISGSISQTKVPTGTCSLGPSQVTVNFNSGVNSGFNGSFQANAVFKPLLTSFEQQDNSVEVQSFSVSVSGTGQLSPGVLGETGTINANLTLGFQNGPLDGDCGGDDEGNRPPAAIGYFAPTTSPSGDNIVINR